MQCPWELSSFTTLKYSTLLADDIIPMLEILLLHVCATSEQLPMGAPAAAESISNNNALSAISFALGFADADRQTCGSGARSSEQDDRFLPIGSWTMRCLEAQSAYIAEFLPGKSMLPCFTSALALQPFVYPHGPRTQSTNSTASLVTV